MFTAREKSQLDVYGIWSVTRNQLHTDDSFTFNRTIKSIKESISHLPDATEEEEEALQTIKVHQAAASCHMLPYFWILASTVSSRFCGDHVSYGVTVHVLCSMVHTLYPAVHILCPKVYIVCMILISSPIIT